MIYMLVFIEKQAMGSEILTKWEFWDTCATSLQSVAPSSHHTLPAVVVTLQQYYCPVTLLVATSYFSLNCYHTHRLSIYSSGYTPVKRIIQLIVSWFLLHGSYFLQKMAFWASALLLTLNLINLVKSVQIRKELNLLRF